MSDTVSPKRTWSAPPACTNLGHPQADGGPVLKETPRAVYFDLICPTCGRSQGIRRVRKEAGNE